jgi:hypothetical protein
MTQLLFPIAVMATLLGALPAAAQVSSAPATAGPAAVQPSAPPAAAVPAPAARWTAADVRQAFELADTDSNGEITRSEAQRLTIMPRSFEDADQNKDGVLVLSEYAAGFAR